VITDEDIAHSALGFNADVGLWTGGTVDEIVPRMIRRYRIHPSHYIRDIFGNPFRPKDFDPSWLTSTVISLAAQMYDSQDFSALPILADALRDAGCENEDILNHCRQPGEHMRGCWCVDLALGKT
jgi:hypothetical protein